MSRVQALFDDVFGSYGRVDVVIANSGTPAVPGFVVEGGQQLDSVELRYRGKAVLVNIVKQGGAQARSLQQCRECDLPRPFQRIVDRAVA